MIRPAGRDDLDSIDVIERESFPLDRFARRNLRRMLAGGQTRFWLASRDGQAAGYAALCFRKGARIARLYSLAVRDGFQGSGLGSALIDTGVGAAGKAGCRAVRLEVRESNLPARKLYERSGFRLLSRHSSYYEDGETALRYERSVTAQDVYRQETDPL